MDSEKSVHSEDKRTNMMNVDNRKNYGRRMDSKEPDTKKTRVDPEVAQRGVDSTSDEEIMDEDLRTEPQTPPSGSGSDELRFNAVAWLQEKLLCKGIDIEVSHFKKQEDLNVRVCVSVKDLQSWRATCWDGQEVLYAHCEKTLKEQLADFQFNDRSLQEYSTKIHSILSIKDVPESIRPPSELGNGSGDTSRGRVKASISFVRDSKVDVSTLLDYRKISECLVEEKSAPLTIINDAIDDYVKGSHQPSPFVFIEGCSGSGKTQLALTYAFAHQYQCIYIPASRASSNKQPQAIYRYFEPLYKVLIDCVQRDIVQGFGGDVSSRMFDESWTAGFLKCLIENVDRKYWFVDWILDNMEDQVIEFNPCTIDNLRILCLRQQDLPIFLIDEFSNVGGTARKELAIPFLRNLLRYVELGLVVFGTNTSIANYLGKDKVESRNPGSLWCILINLRWNPSSVYLDERMNKICSKVSDKHQNLWRFIKQACRKTHIPWFAVMALDFWEKHYNDELTPSRLLFAICEAIYIKVSDDKDIFGHEGGILGQYLLFVPSSMNILEIPKLTVSKPRKTKENVEKAWKGLIHRHFAYLSPFDSFRNRKITGEPSVWTKLCAKNRRFDSNSPPLKKNLSLYYFEKKSAMFYPNCLVPNACEEPLLFLSLGAILPFEQLSARKHIEECKRTFRYVLEEGNPVAKKRDGNALEQLSMTSLCAGSFPSDSFEPLGIGEFFNHFLFHLTNVRLSLNDRSSFDNICKQFIQKEYVPLFVPDVQPTEIPFLNEVFDNPPFGVVCRVKDKLMYDIRAGWISVECKNTGSLTRSRNNSSHLPEILKKIPLSSQLHFIITNKLSHACRTKIYVKRKLKILYVKVSSNEYVLDDLEDIVYRAPYRAEVAEEKKKNEDGPIVIEDRGKFGGDEEVKPCVVIVIPIENMCRK